MYLGDHPVKFCNRQTKRTTEASSGSEEFRAISKGSLYAFLNRMRRLPVSLVSRVLLHKRSFQKLGGRIAVTVLLNLVFPSSFTQTAGLPHGWESYNDRPDILQIQQPY